MRQGGHALSTGTDCAKSADIEAQAGGRVRRRDRGKRTRERSAASGKGKKSNGLKSETLVFIRNKCVAYRAVSSRRD